MPSLRRSRSRPHIAYFLAADLILVLVIFNTIPAQAQDVVAPRTPAPGTGASLADPTTLGPAPTGSGPRPGPVGFFGIAYASIFGSNHQEPWRPLRLETFFTDGWDEPWIAQPDTSGDAQQGWIDAADGSFYRLGFYSYNFSRGLSRRGDGHTGAYTLYTPFNRRLELITTIPFVTSQPTLNLGKQIIADPGSSGSTAGRRTATGFGDLTFTPRFLLTEDDYSSSIAQIAIQTPTGDRATGAGRMILSPGLQFWSNFAEGWVLRGGFAANVGLNRAAGGTSLLSQLAMGRVLTPHDTPLIGDLTLSLSGNVLNRVSSPGTTVVLTPGFRTHLGKDWFFLGGIEVPVTGPRPYAEGVTFWLMKAF